MSPPRRQYPHVDGVTDWQAQQTLRLLWDRLFDLDARLHELETTSGDLVKQITALENRVAEAARNAKESLAITQKTPAEQPATTEPPP